nr:unnamed protein product [Callosobruchus chinensis]
MAGSLSKDLNGISAWGCKNVVDFNASKTLYCSLSNKRCPSEHSVPMNNQALPRGHSFKLLGVSITENMIWHDQLQQLLEESSDIYSKPGIIPRKGMKYCQWSEQDRKAAIGKYKSGKFGLNEICRRYNIPKTNFQEALVGYKYEGKGRN